MNPHNGFPQYPNAYLPTPQKPPTPTRRIVAYTAAGVLAFFALLASWGVTLGPVLALFAVAAVIIAKD